MEHLVSGSKAQAMGEAPYKLDSDSDFNKEDYNMLFKAETMRNSTSAISQKAAVIQKNCAPTDEPQGFK